MVKPAAGEWGGVCLRVFHVGEKLVLEVKSLNPVCHPIPQLAVYTTYIPLIYCLLVGYMLPTTF